MTYRLRSEETLRRVSYHGRLPFAAPLAAVQSPRRRALRTSDAARAAALASG